MAGVKRRRVGLNMAQYAAYWPCRWTVRTRVPDGVKREAEMTVAEQTVAWRTVAISMSTCV